MEYINIYGCIKTNIWAHQKRPRESDQETKRTIVGTIEGSLVGTMEGSTVGATLGSLDGRRVGSAEGTTVGA